MTAADVHLNTGAMALDALPADEAAEFLEHLETCETCRPELAGFHETMARVAAATAEVPPASLRNRVMAAAATTAQLPPMTHGRHAAVEDSGEPTGPIATVTPLRPWFKRPVSWIAAAAVAAALAIGITVVANRPAQTLASCVAEASVKTTSTPTVGTGGDVVSAPSCGAVTVRLPALPAPAAGKGYQMWILKGDTPRPMFGKPETLTPDAQGTYAALTTAVQGGDTAVALSLEPAGGSTTPTDVLWVVPITTA